MMIKGQTNPLVKRKIRGYVILRKLDLPILYILGMYELDIPDKIKLLQEHGAYQSVKITSCNQPLLHMFPPLYNSPVSQLRFLRVSVCPFVTLYTVKCSATCRTSSSADRKASATFGSKCVPESFLMISTASSNLNAFL